MKNVTSVLRFSWDLWSHVLEKGLAPCIPEIIDMSVTSVIFLIPTSVLGRKVQTDENSLLYLRNPKELPEFASNTLLYL